MLARDTRPSGAASPGRPDRDVLTGQFLGLGGDSRLTPSTLRPDPSVRRSVSQREEQPPQLGVPGPNVALAPTGALVVFALSGSTCHVWPDSHHGLDLHRGLDRHGRLVSAGGRSGRLGSALASMSRQPRQRTVRIALSPGSVVSRSAGSGSSPWRHTVDLELRPCGRAAGMFALTHPLMVRAAPPGTGAHGAGRSALRPGANGGIGRAPSPSQLARVRLWSEAVGSCTWKRHPPLMLVTLICPWCACTMPRAIASPSPVPWSAG